MSTEACANSPVAGLLGSSGHPSEASQLSVRKSEVVIAVYIHSVSHKLCINRKSQIFFQQRKVVGLPQALRGCV